jgi:uncharacterized protein YodC (DUF2158 family)
MADQLQVGDIVKLKSGGPDMTVESFDDSIVGMYVNCVWFDGSEVKRNRFPTAAVESARAP